MGLSSSGGSSKGPARSLYGSSFIGVVLGLGVWGFRRSHSVRFRACP